MAKIAGDWKQPLTREEMEDIRRASRNEQSVRARFWESLKRVARNLPFAEDLVAAFFCATDPRTDIKVRATLFGALAYFILPIDVLPDIAPLIGFTDDAAVLALALRAVAGAITPEHRRKAKEKLAE
jgi:uncharacterized membrane protein YkvA (DUF1232 family)